MSRKKQIPEESAKRALILKTAQKLFVTQGYAEVSMDALADAVPVSKRTLYNHFRDKKALFTAVMQARCEFISQAIEKILLEENRDVVQMLTHMGKQFLSVVLKPEAINIYRTAITQVSHFPDMGKLFYASGPMRCKGMFADYLEKLDRQGELDIPNSKRAADVFFSMLVGRMQMRMLLGVEKRVKQKEMDEHIDYAVRVFMRGQRPAAARR